MAVAEDTLNKTQVESMKEEEPGVAVHTPTLGSQRQEDLLSLMLAWSA